MLPPTTSSLQIILWHSCNEDLITVFYIIILCFVFPKGREKVTKKEMPASINNISFQLCLET